MRRSGVRLPSAPPVPKPAAVHFIAFLATLPKPLTNLQILYKNRQSLTDSTMTPDTQLNTTETTTQNPKSAARYLPHIARVLMGVMFFIFGLNGFLNFIPPPKSPMPEGAIAFSGALMKTGYMFPLIMGTQLLVGVLLLLNR